MNHHNELMASSDVLCEEKVSVLFEYIYNVVTTNCLLKIDGIFCGQINVCKPEL